MDLTSIIPFIHCLIFFFSGTKKKYTTCSRNWKFLFEIFAGLKSFQLIDSSIPWLKWLAQQETKFLRG